MKTYDFGTKDNSKRVRRSDKYKEQKASNPRVSRLLTSCIAAGIVGITPVNEIAAKIVGSGHGQAYAQKCAAVVIGITFVLFLAIDVLAYYIIRAIKKRIG